MQGNNRETPCARVAVKTPQPDSLVEVRVTPPDNNFELKVGPGSDLIELRIQPGASLIEVRIGPPPAAEETPAAEVADDGVDGDAALDAYLAEMDVPEPEPVLEAEPEPEPEPAGLDLAPVENEEIDLGPVDVGDVDLDHSIPAEAPPKPAVVKARPLALAKGEDEA